MFFDDICVKLKKVLIVLIVMVLFKCGLCNQFIQGVVLVVFKDENMVGLVFILCYIFVCEDRNLIIVFCNVDYLQWVVVEICLFGYVLVMDGCKDVCVVIVGLILIMWLVLCGVVGVVIDVGMCDVDGIGKLDMLVYFVKFSVLMNLILYEVLDIDVLISCGDVVVFFGDIMVGDKDGVMVIFVYLVDEIVDECIGMEFFEDFVLEQVQGGVVIIGFYFCIKDENQKKYDDWCVCMGC